MQDRPGVTRQNRWFTVGKGFELLDTPGVLWPKFEDPIVGEHLAFTGAVRDEILDMESLAARLLELADGAVPQRHQQTGRRRTSAPRSTCPATSCWSGWAASAGCSSPAAR